LYDDFLVSSQRPSGGTGDDEADPNKLHLRSAFEKFIRYGSGEGAIVSMSAEEKRALANSADSDGGFLIPIDFEGSVIMNAYNESAIRPLVGAQPTGRDTVFMPALARPKTAWGVTGIALTPQELEAGGHTLQIFDLKALTLIHNNTLEDAESDVWGELSSAFSMSIAEEEDNAFAVGAGDHSPQGVIQNTGVAANFTLTGVANGMHDASNNGVDVLIKALYKLKATYRRNATFCFNSTTESVVRQYKDDNGQYLWQPPVQSGSPATLLGRPVANPEGLPDGDTDGLLPIFVGDLRRGYRIRDRSGISVQRLVERYAEYDQTGFIVKRRTGGQVVLPEAFQVIKVGA
jgi:HK97 family phage major capsid protein